MEGSAATLAIVDGTHLCLLPASSSFTGSESHNDNDGNAYAWKVPALHLHHVMRFLSPKRIHLDRNALEPTSHFGTSDNPIGISGGTDLTELMCLLPSRQLSYATVQHPTRRGLIRAYVDAESDGILVHHSERNQKKKDSVSVSFERPCSNIVASSKSVNATRSTSTSTSLLEVRNIAGTLTSDYCGLGGFDQILLIPSLSSDKQELVDIQSISGQKGKDILAGMLAGCALTDGTSVILPRLPSTAVEPEQLPTSSDGRTTLLVLPSVNPVVHWMETKARYKIDLDDKTKDDSGSATGEAPSNHILESNDPAPGAESHHKEHQDPPQPWKEKLYKALQSRLGAEQRASKRQRYDAAARNELVRRSRCALEGLTDTPCRPAMVRLKYSTMPLGGGCTGGGGKVRGSLGVGLLLCVDVSCIGTGTAGDAGSLRGLHLSFSPAQSSSTSAWDASSIEVESSSGTVPLLPSNECVSIMASVDVTGLTWSRGQKGSDGSIRLAINALWRDDSVPASSSSKDTKKKGCVLGLFKLPHESLLLSSSHGAESSAASNGFTHEIDWTRNHSDGIIDPLHRPTATSSPLPRAVLEYRDPRVITVDVSQCLGGADGGCLRGMVDDLNDALSASCGRNRIELCCPSNGPPTHPRIIVLAQTPDERLGLIRLVMENLPESARVVGTTAGGEIDQMEEDGKIVNALLYSIHEEVNLLDSHRRMKSENMSLSTVAALANAQAKTDEVASRLDFKVGLGATHDDNAIKGRRRG